MCDQDPSTIRYALTMISDPLLWAILMLGAWAFGTMIMVTVLVKDRRSNPLPIIDHAAPPHTHGTERYPDGIPYVPPR